MANSYENSNITNSVYKYKASGFYILGKEKFTIDYTNIRSIIVDHDYDNNNMPLVYAMLNLSTKVIDRIVKNKDTGLFILNIQKCIDNSDMPELWKDYINDTFIYFVTEDINKTDTRDYKNTNEGREDIYKEITVGLLSQKLVNGNKKTVNGIIQANNMMSAVAYVANTGRPLLIEPFENNGSLKSIFIPPRSSIAESIKYLNGINTFYNTKYRYYMDFDVSYLLSSRGKAVPKRGERVNSVMIILRNDYDMASKIQGMSTDETNRYYMLEVGATNAEVADYREKSKRYTKVRFTNTKGKNGDYSKSSPSSNSNFVNKTTHLRAPNDNTNLITNAEKTSNFYIAINKTDIDAAAFTPNKEYNINTDEVYVDCDYSGRFLLKRKRELYFKSTGNTSDYKFTLSTMLFFERVYE